MNNFYYVTKPEIAKTTHSPPHSLHSLTTLNSITHYHTHFTQLTHSFFPKWIIINFLINNNMYLMTFIFIMMSLIMLFFYIRISYSAFMFNYLKMKWFKIFIKNNYFMMINFFSFISLMGMILSTFFFY